MNSRFLGIAVTTGVAISAFVAVAPEANAMQIGVPDTTVLGGNVTSGPVLNVNNLMSDDILSIQASGAFGLDAGTGLVANTAGVLLLPSVFGEPVGSTSPSTRFGGLGGGPVLASAPFGSLLLGNSDLGFAQVFPANPLNGLGSATPPTTLAVNTTFGDLFPTLASASPYTGALQWRVNDLLTSGVDNGGLISITNVPTAAIPTPALLPGLIGMGAAALRKRKQEAEGEA